MIINIVTDLRIEMIIRLHLRRSSSKKSMVPSGGGGQGASLPVRLVERVTKRKNLKQLAVEKRKGNALLERGGLIFRVQSQFSVLVPPHNHNNLYRDVRYCFLFIEIY